ncbi:unknown protein [Oryza sativa Japonica Group]|uniref:Os01g0683700 protein n=2 Tax=Oryza sativa subsp. japonica TaxID=39947 RepID=Q5N8Q2_ORYSJ|nr:unknown protein [Oryza sativa Japonica Group]BAD82507.1 unknown protein [Oryza sativa Japonica Group]BAH91237.1 Os01g0683700 [Oryza sativa Japonica Group]BAS73729.1 Os01g0683700 [Oryza sativa Japonica Group]|eukprot:NP_001172507.1 Os01g0683700 [Oryza sativa Japonica Group]
MVREEKLDFVLVPLGLAVLAVYHLWLLYAVLRHPTRTVVGLNAIARKRWVTVMMAVEHGEERRAGRADAAEQHHGVDGACHDGHHARLRHQRLPRRHGGKVPGVPLVVVVGGAAAGVREQDRGGVRGQVPGHLALLHARLRLQRAGHPPVRARQLPPRPAARRRRGGGGGGGGGGGSAGGVRGVRGADGEQGEPLLVAGTPRLLRVAGALHVDVRAHPDAGVQRAHVRTALLPRHHQGARRRRGRDPPRSQG